MISGVKDFTNRGPERSLTGPQAAKPDKPANKPDSEDSFLSRLGNADRTERNEKPGREDRVTTREGKRSAESETQTPQSPSKASVRRTEKSEKKKPDSERPEAPDASVESRLQQQLTVAKPIAKASVDGTSDMPEAGEELAPQGLNPSAPSSSLQKAAMPQGEVAPMMRRSPEGEADSATDETIRILESIRDDETDVRKATMEQFLGDMQREFGIPPEKIAQAFSKMDTETLAAPADESTKAFIANLELAPEADQAKAAQMYQNMVRTTGEAALSEQLAGVEEGVKFDVVSPREASLRKLNSAIDDMNDMFALRGNPNPGQVNDPTLKQQLAAENMEAQLARLMREPRESKRDDKSMAVLGMAGGALGAAAAGGSGSAATTSASAPSTASTLAAIDSATLGALSMPSMGGNASGFESAGEGLGQGASAAGASEGAVSSSLGAANEAFAAALAGEKTSSTKSGEEKVDSTKTDAKNTTGAEVDPSTLSQQPSQPRAASLAAGPSAMMIGRPIATPQDEQANIRELIQQAQVVLKKGGGEMKMDLKPEGIGQVRLKVSVEDGQVNVQMLTDSNEAKKLLEKGLHELKSNLAAHQLKVDTVKVDVGQELQKHMDQRSDEQKNEQQRQSAMDFMNQMRDERQALRQGFMENTGWRSYNQGGRRSPVDPDNVSTSVASASSSGGDAKAKSSGSGRLDLVA